MKINLLSELLYWKDKVLSVDIPEGKDEKMLSVFIETNAWFGRIYAEIIFCWVTQNQHAVESLNEVIIADQHNRRN